MYARRGPRAKDQQQNKLKVFLHILIVGNKGLLLFIQFLTIAYLFTASSTTDLMMKRVTEAQAAADRQRSAHQDLYERCKYELTQLLSNIAESETGGSCYVRLTLASFLHFNTLTFCIIAVNSICRRYCTNCRLATAYTK